MGCNTSSRGSSQHIDLHQVPVPDLPETIDCGSSATNDASPLDASVKVTEDDIQVRGSVRALCPAGTISRASASAPYTTQQNDTIMEMLANSNKANYTNRMNPKENRSFEIFRILNGKGDKPDEVIFRNHRAADSTPVVGSEVEVYFTKGDEWIAAIIDRPHDEPGKVCVRYHDMPDHPFGVEAQRIRCVPSNYYVSFWIDHGDNDNLKWCAYRTKEVLQPGEGTKQEHKSEGRKFIRCGDKILPLDLLKMQKFTFTGVNETVNHMTRIINTRQPATMPHHRAQCHNMQDPAVQQAKLHLDMATNRNGRDGLRRGAFKIGAERFTVTPIDKLLKMVPEHEEVVEID